jgi:hypothetical protein
MIRTNNKNMKASKFSGFKGRTRLNSVKVDLSPNKEYQNFMTFWQEFLVKEPLK